MKPVLHGQADVHASQARIEVRLQSPGWISAVSLDDHWAQWAAATTVGEADG